MSIEVGKRYEFLWPKAKPSMRMVQQPRGGVRPPTQGQVVQT